jgi:putative two-component system response regulator
MAKDRRILVIDDDENICKSLSVILTREGYKVLTAQTGADAIEKAQHQHFDLALLDIKLPDMQGVALMPVLKELNPDTSIMMISGYASLENALQALNSGASGYITKPYAVPDVVAKVKEALEKQQLVVENRRLYDAAQRELAERRRAEEQLQKSLSSLRRAMEGIIQAMTAAGEMRDPYTAGHQRRVTQLACATARELGLDDMRIEGLRVAGLLHDIGKMHVPAEILSRPGKLNALEFGLIRCHPQVGYDILRAIEFPWPIAEIVLQHHERVDGSGYPRGLVGQEMLLEARILSIADVVESMSSDRPYRPAFGMDRALEEISGYRGTLYDSDVVDACLRLFDERSFTFEDRPAPTRSSSR